MNLVRVLNPLRISSGLINCPGIPRSFVQPTAFKPKDLLVRRISPINSFPQHKWFSTKPEKADAEIPIKTIKPIKSTASVPAPKLQQPKNLSVYTIPNILTFTRIIGAPFIGYFIVNGNTHIALLLFLYSCITDFVDGYIARRWNMKSDLGSIIDPLADKLLMTVTTLSLAYVNSFPAVVASIIIGRDVILSLMTIFYAYRAIPAPKSFAKLLAIGKNGTISIHPNLLGKVNTALQMVYIGGLVFKPVIESVILMDLDFYFLGMGILVGTTTLLSGLSYVFSKDAVRILKK